MTWIVSKNIVHFKTIYIYIIYATGKKSRVEGDGENQ